MCILRPSIYSGGGLEKQRACRPEIFKGLVGEKQREWWECVVGGKW